MESMNLKKQKEFTGVETVKTCANCGELLTWGNMLNPQTRWCVECTREAHPHLFKESEENGN